MERARESLGRVVPVCNPRGRGAYLRLTKPIGHVHRAWWLCEPAGECSSGTHTGLRVSVMPDHHAPTLSTLVSLYANYLTGY